MSGKNAGKFDICFYHYCPANRSSKKRGWLRAFLIGAAGCAAPWPMAENFIYELQAENCRSRQTSPTPI